MKVISKENITSLSNIIGSYRLLFSVNVIVVLAGAIFEGVGIGMLVPVLESINVGDEGRSHFSALAKDAFQYFGVHYDFISLITVFAVFMLMKYFFLMLQQRLARILSSSVTRDLRKQCTENLLSVSLKYYYGVKIGNIISTVFNSTQNTGGTLEYLVMLIRGVVFAFVYVTVASLLSFELTAALTLFIAIAYFFVWPRFVKGKKYGLREKKLMDKIHSELQDKFGGIKVVKQFSAENKMFSEISELVTQYQKNAVKLVDNKIISYAFFEPFLFLVLVSFIVVSVELLSLPVSSLLVTLIIFTQIIPQFKLINSNLLMINELLPHYSKVQELISRKGKPFIKNGVQEIDDIEQKIEYKDVSFRYANEEERVLNNISIEIPVNKTIAIVGGSGGGKSTLIELLVRNHDPEIGKILVDGFDLRNIKIESWKNIISVVDQDCYLFHDSISENIKYGKPGASNDEVIAAAKQAHAHEFIKKMEDGYATIIGHRGVKMSGGQRQRLTLARALLRKPKLLILDEATSALDSESERLIQESLDELKGKITIVVIAHRLSTIKKADKIIFMENGQVLESGAHEELMSLDGNYKYLVNLQSQNKG